MYKLLLTTTMIAAGLSTGDLLAKQDDLFTGGYVSARTGYAVGRFKADVQNGNGPWKKDHKNINSAIFGMSLGYQHKFDNNFLTGIELVGNYHDHSKGHSNLQNANLEKHYAKMSNEYSYGLDAKAGVVFCKCLAYGKVGVEWANLSHQRSFESRRRVAEAFVQGLQSKKNKTHTGLVLGLGMEKKLNDKISIGGEFRHVHYNRKEYKHEGNNISGTHKIRPNLTRFLATVNYRF